MTTSTLTTPSTSDGTAAPEPVPRWVFRIAHVVPFTVLPAALWRFALGFGVPVGFTGPMARLYHAPGWITLYVTGLNLLSEGLALLTLGLVLPWGEALPRWVPYLGGRRIPTLAATIPAALGAAALMVLSVVIALGWNSGTGTDPDYPYYPHGFAGGVMTAAYAPGVLWGPLLAIVTIAYYRRRTSGTSRKGRPA